MSFSDGRSPGGHFRGRYAPSKPTQAAPPPPQAPAPPPAPPEASSPPAAATPNPLEPQRSIPASGLVASVLLAGAVVVLAVLIANRPPVQEARQDALPWQASCGSPPVSGSSWWPVLGPREALEVVRRSYCGDAFVTPAGVAQVASFSTFEQASAFAQRLTSASGYSFRVGQPHSP